MITYTRLGLGIKGVGPRLGSIEFANQCAIAGNVMRRRAARLRSLHKGVVHGHHEDRTGFLELGVIDVAGDVAGRAGGAWSREGG